MKKVIALIMIGMFTACTCGASLNISNPNILAQRDAGQDVDSGNALDATIDREAE